MLTSLKLKLLSIAMLADTATETTEEVTETLKGWDKFVDWAGGNFNALFILVAGILLLLFGVWKLIKYVKRVHNKNYVARDKVAWYKRRKKY